MRFDRVCRGVRTALWLCLALVGTGCATGGQDAIGVGTADSSGDVSRLDGSLPRDAVEASTDSQAEDVQDVDTEDALASETVAEILPDSLPDVLPDALDDASVPDSLDAVAADAVMDDAAPEVAIDAPPDSTVDVYVDASTDVPPDSGPETSVDATPPITRGKVGKSCTTDFQCDSVYSLDNYCSNNVFASGSLNPSAVCVGATCDPGSGTTIRTCDDSAGVCLYLGPSSGICFGACGFTDDGVAPIGCAGKNVCNAYGIRTPATGGVVGVGYCFGGCVSTSDCPVGEKCQLEEGICKNSLDAYTKKLGDACTKADVAAPAKCSCLYTSAAGDKGYCSTFCKMGETACAAGYTCDASLPKAQFAKAPKGLAANCLKNCSVDSDCTALGAYCEEMGGTSQKTCQPGKR